MTVTFYFVFLLAAVFNANGFIWPSEDVLIVGGDEVDITEYPYQVRLSYRGHKWCGGSIISDEHILTAAHCLEDVPIEDITVVVGTSYTDKGGRVYEAKTAFTHPQNNNRNLDYDFAVLQMAEKLAIDNVTSRIVKLADSGSSLEPGVNIIVTGWGATQEGDWLGSSVLRAVAVPVVDLKSCSEMYPEGLVTDRMLCAGLPEGGKDACQGDSGGPAVSVDDHVQYGVVSWGYGCAREGQPGVYAYIPAARDWIREVSGV